jgi:transcriptional regulator with XRE-family HTH domain
MNELGERLRNFRERAGLSQKELARRAGVTQQAISSWEAGTRTDIGGRNLIKTAEALGVEPNTLLTGPLPDETLSEEDRTVLKAFRALDIEQKAVALRLLRALK